MKFCWCEWANSSILYHAVYEWRRPGKAPRTSHRALTIIMKQLAVNPRLTARELIKRTRPYNSYRYVRWHYASTHPWQFKIPQSLRKETAAHPYLEEARSRFWQDSRSAGYNEVTAHAVHGLMRLPYLSADLVSMCRRPGSDLFKPKVNIEFYIDLV